MTVILRPYQEECLDAVRVSLRQHRRVLLYLPTGGGKTQIGARMAKNITAKRLRAWFTVHRDFLIHQTSATFDAHGIPHSFIAAGRSYNPYMPIQICSIDTLRNRLDRLTPPDLVIVDEAHHAISKSWARTLKWAGKSRIVGLTATPQRLDGKGLDDIFEDLVLGPSVAWLIEEGYLSDYRAYAPTAPDVTGVHSRAGDYARDEIEDIMDTGTIIGDMVRHYRERANGLRAIYFGVSIRHSQHIAATFNASGIPARHIDGNTPTHERVAAAVDFASKRIFILCAADLIGEGYDLSSQAGMEATIEAVGLARPTQSLALHLQQIGRSLRPKPHPAIILDHAGNLARHGLPDQHRDWTLKGREKRKRGEDDAAPVRQCPVCFGVHSAAQTKCPYCGHIYEIIGREVDEVDGDLEEIDVAAIRRSRKMEEWRCRTKDDLIALAVRRGYRNPEKWASFMWEAREKRRMKMIQDQAQYYLFERGDRI